jgi:hypothetical protein
MANPAFSQRSYLPPAVTADERRPPKLAIVVADLEMEVERGLVRTWSG